MSEPAPLLSVSAAAARLGVHVSTVRRWTDDGVLAEVRTPGGHRRIPASAVASLCRKRASGPSDSADDSPAGAPGPATGDPAPRAETDAPTAGASAAGATTAQRAWADHAVVHARYEVQAHPDAVWNQAFAGGDRAHRRETGRELVGLLLRHVAGQGDPDAREAEVRRLSWGYALDMKDRGLRLTEALRATLFFRDVLTESSAFYPRFEDGADPVALMRRVNEFMNSVQMAIAEAYEEG